MHKVLALQSLKAEKNIELHARSTQSNKCGDDNRSSISYYRC